MTLWRNHPATPQQQGLFTPKKKQRSKPTQADVLATMLRQARGENRALDLPDILKAGIAQFTARIFELRERGFEIENELRRSPDGRTLSRYWLRFDPEGGAE
jgi:hypothetical protein